MQGFPTQEQVKRIREQYPIGTRIELDSMNGERDMPPGLQGTVRYVDDAGQLGMGWDNGRSLSLVPNADHFHILQTNEQEKDMQIGVSPTDKSRTERFIDHINANILPFIDYKELDKSCRTEEKAYAKGILNLLHTAMTEQYGGTTLAPEYRSMEDDYVVVPGVIQGKKSGNIALALLGIDLASSGEHCQTDILCRYGVVSQGDDSPPPYVKDEISVDFMPYDYGYTAQIPGDIHVRRNRQPEGIRDMLDSFQNHTIELTRPVEAGLEAGDEENDMER